jgi:hypothetical protein
LNHARHGIAFSNLTGIAGGLRKIISFGTASNVMVFLRSSLPDKGTVTIQPTFYIYRLTGVKKWLSPLKFPRARDRSGISFCRAEFCPVKTYYSG